MRRRRLSAAACCGVCLVTVLACSSNGTQPVGPDGAGGDVMLVSGTLVREENAHTWNEPFIADAAAHVKIQLLSFPAADGPAFPFVTLERPIVALPFGFELRSDGLFSDVILSATVYNHAGNEVRVGDLTNEYLEEIDGIITTNREIRVSGLESCDAPNAGGFCVRNE